MAEQEGHIAADTPHPGPGCRSLRSCRCHLQCEALTAPSSNLSASFNLLGIERPKWLCLWNNNSNCHWGSRRQEQHCESRWTCRHFVSAHRGNNIPIFYFIFKKSQQIYKTGAPNHCDSGHEVFRTIAINPNL